MGCISPAPRAGDVHPGPQRLEDVLGRHIWLTIGPGWLQVALGIEDMFRHRMDLDGHPRP